MPSSDWRLFKYILSILKAGLSSSYSSSTNRDRSSKVQAMMEKQLLTVVGLLSGRSWLVIALYVRPKPCQEPATRLIQRFLYYWFISLQESCQTVSLPLGNTWYSPKCLISYISSPLIGAGISLNSPYPVLLPFSHWFHHKPREKTARSNWVQSFIAYNQHTEYCQIKTITF